MEKMVFCICSIYRFRRVPESRENIMKLQKSYRIAASAILFSSVVLLIIFSYSDYHLRSGRISSGYLDLSCCDLEHTIYSLDGDWNFYPNLFCSAADGSSAGASPQSLYVPGHFPIDSASEKILFGTYELRITLPSPGTYFLKTSLISGAYRLFCNGVPVNEVGTVGTSSETEKSVWQSAAYLLRSDTCEMLLTLHVSNYHCHQGGIIDNLFLGSVGNIYRFQTMQALKSAFIIGIFAGLGIYLLLLTCKTQHRRIGLFLCIFCLASALMESILDANVFLMFFKNQPILLTLKAEITTYAVLLCSVSYFLNGIYPVRTGKILLKSLEYCNLAYLILILCSNSYAETTFLGSCYVFLLVLNSVVQLFHIIQAIRYQKSYACLTLMSIVVLSLLCILQILITGSAINLQLYTTDNLFIIGILFFILCQTNILLTDVDLAYQNAKQADSMEIAYLQAQISPHFMFNTLNNVSYLMNRNVSEAQTLLLQFCDFLKVKHKFDYRKQIFYTLGEELDFLTSYVAIENIRLNGMISMNIEVDESLKSIKIMPLLLQPLVENAIKHGYSSKPLSILIRVTDCGEYYLFTVQDDGRGMNEIQLRNLHSSGKSGVGIANINYRLNKLCGETLHFSASPGNGTVITFQYTKGDLSYESRNRR